MVEIDRDSVLNALHAVKDPEIPGISLVDLGVITSVVVSDLGDVKVVMTPTFTGCPAFEVMKREVQEALEKLDAPSVCVEVNFDIPWSSNLVTEAGRKALLKHGLAPPEVYEIDFPLEVLEHVACPYCNSTDTELKSPFGSALCRSLHYCQGCRQAFEAFKPL